MGARTKLSHGVSRRIRHIYPHKSRTVRQTEFCLTAPALSLLLGRHFLLQLFQPVQYDVDLRRGRLPPFGGHEHQEALAVWETRRNWEACSESACTGPQRAFPRLAT